MKYLIPLLLTSCAAPQIDGYYGRRDFDDSYNWQQTDQQHVYGGQFSFVPKDGFGPEVGILLSETTSNDKLYVNRPVHNTRTDVRDLYFGVRRNFMVTDWLQLYVSGGVSSIRVETQVNLTYDSPLSRDDTEFAPYAVVGGSVFLSDEFSIGGAYRRNFLDTEADIFINNPDLNGGTFLFSVGYHF